MRIFEKIRADLCTVFTLVTKIDLRDVFALGGLSMVGYGAHAIYAPAGWIVVGVVLCWIGMRR